MCNNYGFIITALLIFANGIKAIEKTWICNTNADDKEHWIGGNYSKNCKGFYFPKDLGDSCSASIKQITTNAIYLPMTADIILRDNAEITLSEKSETCVKVDQIHTKNWTDPTCWNNYNRATPHVERLPCRFDDVIFPKDATYSVFLDVSYGDQTHITVRDKRILHIEWLLNAMYGQRCSEFVIDTSSIWRINLRPNPNQQKSTNICHYKGYNDIICERMRNSVERVVCSDPIKVVGHCTGFCGSVMHIKPGENFDIEKFLENFTKNQPKTDAYYSVIDDKNLTYQVTMTDSREFTGDSLYYSEEFYEKVKDDLKSWNIEAISANFSGLPINPEKMFEHVMGVIFGTFFTVVILFGLLYLFYLGPLKDTRIVSRMPLRSGAKRTTKPFLFARFENKDDGSMSMGGSIVSLDKAFDNPMYGHQMASTSSETTMETVEEAEEINEDKKLKSESTFSNPMYEEEGIVQELHDDEE